MADDERSGIRLQKVLAAAGVASRRASEELIDAGRVSVDGEVVHEQGRRVDPASADIRVDGVRITTAESGLVHLALNKPRGVVSTMNDPEGRPDLAQYVRRSPAGKVQRLFHVGRLDADTEGVILLTNEGELAHRLTHPTYGVEKTYIAEVPGPMPRGVGAQLREGVELDDGPAQVDSFKVVGRSGSRIMVEVVLHEGRKHIVRRLLEAVGHPVQRLVRTQFGPVLLGDLRPGVVRALTREEVAALRTEVGL